MPRRRGQVPTELSALNSGTHGRERRNERNIEKIDLQRARRYGMAEEARNGRIRYTYGGIVFIYCPKKNREVTCFPSSDLTGGASGTKFTNPVLLDKVHSDISEFEHDSLARSLWRKPQKWTSHSVLVVDMSGSMRRDDVNGARCRSDGVWMALARDYIKAPLDKKERGASDLVSIVVMKDEAEVIIEREPTTNVLYNKLIDMREWSHLRPSGPGNYIPAIEVAETLLTANANAGCSLSLLFFSDGRPSDTNGDFTTSIGNLASKFGRRLSLTCIGMAENNEDFTVLNDMVTEAKSYGSQACFGKPSLDADSLSNIVSSLASSLTVSRTEITEAKTGKCRELRDVIREKKNAPDHVGSWEFYDNRNRGVRVVGFSSWQYKQNDYVRLIDPRCAVCYEHVGYTSSAMKGIVCSGCHAYSLCFHCQRNSADWLLLHRSKQANGKGSECDRNLAKVRCGELIRIPSEELPSFSIAYKENIFGEGAERIVRKVRFVDENGSGSFVGAPMVAKESRFIENHNNDRQRRDYHRDFMRTQDISAEYAKKFNEALNNLQNYFGDLSRRDIRVLQCLPRIEFIKPLVVELQDAHRKRIVLLIEKSLEGEYTKFNNNMGRVKGKEEDVSDDSDGDSDDEEDNELDGLIDKMNNNFGVGGLGAIEEGSEDEEEEEEDTPERIEEELFDTKKSAPISGSYHLGGLKDEYFPQAFSHFTYEKSRKHLMVVDLQGVLTVRKDGSRVYELTDPAIHRRRTSSQRFGKRWDFGRTDRHDKGIRAFFKTHECNEVCKLLGLREELNVCRKSGRTRTRRKRNERFSHHG